MHTNKALTIYFFLSFFSLLNLTNKAARAADFYNNKTTKQDNLANVQAVSFCKSKKKEISPMRGEDIFVSLFCKFDPGIEIIYRFSKSPN